MANLTPLIIFAVAMVVFYMFLLYPQKRKAKEHQQLIEGLIEGDMIMTIGGIIGMVRQVNEDILLLEVAEDVVVTVARQSVARKIDSPNLTDLFADGALIIEKPSDASNHKQVDG
jgi:preprotein translocase subunit YajC